MITIDSNLWLLNLLQKRLFYKNFRNKEKTWTTIILLLPSSKKGWLNNNRKIRSGSIFIIVHVCTLKSLGGSFAELQCNITCKVITD